MKAKHLLIGAVALAWAVASPAKASAEFTPWSDNQFCTTGAGFVACASVSLRVVNGGTELVLTIANDGPDGVFTKIGLFHLTASPWSGLVTGYQVLQDGVDVTGNWTTPASTGFGEFQGMIELQIDANAPAPHNAVQLLQTFTFHIFLAQSTPWTDVSDTQAAWFIQSLGEDGELSARGSTVPEPGTMALLGTGLVGILGVAGVRRRRNGLDVENG